MQLTKPYPNNFNLFFLDCKSAGAPVLLTITCFGGRWWDEAGDSTGERSCKKVCMIKVDVDGVVILNYAPDLEIII